MYDNSSHSAVASTKQSALTVYRRGQRTKITGFPIYKLLNIDNEQ